MFGFSTLAANVPAIEPVPTFLRLLFCFQLTLFIQKPLKLPFSKALALWPVSGCLLHSKLYPYLSIKKILTMCTIILRSYILLS